MNKKIIALLVEPRKAPEKVKIENSLPAMKKAVGGYAEITYPWTDDVGVVYNEAGKYNGLRPNRALYGEGGEVCDIIFGNFLVVGVDNENNKIRSLTQDEIATYNERFQHPEMFFQPEGGKVKVFQVSANPPERGPEL